MPDAFFFSGELYDGRDFNKIFNKKLMPYLKRFRSPQEISASEETAKKKNHLDLCPIARQLIRRYSRYRDGVPAQPTIFLSYGGVDEATARQTYDRLLHKVCKQNMFFFPKCRFTDVLSRSIDSALDSAECLIVVGSTLDNICRPRCAYEWKRFCRELSAKLKPSETTVIPFILKDLNADNLPRELAEYRAQPFHPTSFDKDVDELAERIPARLRRSAAEASAGR